MEHNRNWQGWVALALAGLALMVALVGRNPSPAVTIAVGADAGQAQAQPAQPAPPFGGRDWRGNAQTQPANPQGRGGDWREYDQQGPGFGPNAPFPGRGHHGDFGPGRPGHGFPFFLPFMLISGLIKLAGVALVVWLLARWFRNRRNHSQPPSAPTTQV